MKNLKSLQQYITLIGVVSVIICSTPLSHGENQDVAPVIQILKGGPMSKDDVVESLRHLKIVTNWEGSLSGREIKAKDMNITLPRGAISIDAYLSKIAEAFGCKVEREPGIVTFYYDDVRQEGQKYALNAKIDEIQIDKAVFGDAVNLMAIKEGLNIRCITFGDLSFDNGKKISLKLHDVTVREALNQLVKASGLLGWNSKPLQMDKDNPGIMVDISIH